MTKSLIGPLWIDPGGGVLDLPGAAGMGAFEVGRQDNSALGQDFAGRGINYRIVAETHAFDAEIAEV